MRIIVATVVGIAGLASLFYYCDPLRNKVATVVLGQPEEVLSQDKAPPEPAGHATAKSPAEPHEAAEPERSL